MNATARLLVLDDPAAECAARVAAAAGASAAVAPAAAASAGVGRGAGRHIALTGGSTPRAAYEKLATMEIDWSGTSLWWGDERCVPRDDERSNYGMAAAALIDRLELPLPAIHRIEGERAPDDAAQDYERQLREAFGDGVPKLDLVLLGLGPDAHIASMFPGQASLRERSRLAVAVQQPGLAPWVSRVTLTLPVIDNAGEVLFLVSGADKAEAVARAFAGEPTQDAPASLVAPASGKLTVLLDRAAAARLPAGAAA